MSSQVIATRVANALIEDAELSLRGPGLDTVQQALTAYRKAYGGLWVGGRATLTAAELSFRPNAVNRAVQSGTLDITVPLSSVTGVGTRFGVLTRIVVIHTPGFLVQLRCFRARAFAEQIQATARRVS